MCSLNLEESREGTPILPIKSSIPNKISLWYFVVGASKPHRNVIL